MLELTLCIILFKGCYHQLHYAHTSAASLCCRPSGEKPSKHHVCHRKNEQWQSYTMWILLNCSTLERSCSHGCICFAILEHHQTEVLSRHISKLVWLGRAKNQYLGEHDLFSLAEDGTNRRVYISVKWGMAWKKRKRLKRFVEGTTKHL